MMPEQDTGWVLEVPSEVTSPAEPIDTPPFSPETEVVEPSAPGKGLFSSTVPTGAPPPLHRLLEAMLFAAPGPLTATQAAESIRGLTLDQYQQAIQTLQQAYRRQGRPYDIQRQGEGYRLILRSHFRPLVERLYGGVKEARLTYPVVEALAVVAYRQPVTKTEVDSLRGHDSGPMLRQLLRRGLIVVQGKAADGQGEVQFVTPPRFLEFFQLSGLEDLPRVDDLPYL